MDVQSLAIGIDIGGTQIGIGLVDRSGNVLAREEFATRCPGGFDQAMARMIDICRKMAASGAGVRGIGMGCPGPLDLSAGCVLNPFTMDWQGRNIVQPLRQALGMDVRLENDADAALVGEAACGAGKGMDKVVMLTFGTGAGGSALIDGQVVRGAAREHPEIGHMPAVAGGPACYCGVDGCLEVVASGQAVNRQVDLLHLDGPAELFAAARDGQPAAAAFVRQLQEGCRTAAATLVRLYCPRRIILGGGIIDHQYETYAAPMRQAIARLTMMPPCGVDVAQAMLGNDAGMIGAAMLILLQR